jgi:hypothetical protein
MASCLEVLLVDLSFEKKRKKEKKEKREKKDALRMWHLARKN